MKIFVGSSFLNKRGARRIMRELVAAGHTITYDWTVNPAARSMQVLGSKLCLIGPGLRKLK